jgi:hypothetical protein
MTAILEKDFTKVWQALKKNAGVKSSPWFKKADAAVSKKVEAYQKAVAKAKSGLSSDLVKVKDALEAMDKAFKDFLDTKGLNEVKETDLKKTEKETLVKEITNYKREVEEEKKKFEVQFKKLMAACKNDLKKIDSLDAKKKVEIWDSMGIDLK